MTSHRRNVQDADPDLPERETPTIERVLGRGEDPLTWSVPLFRLGATSYRLHVLFLIVLAAELMLAVPKDRLAPWHVTVVGLCALTVICIREVGRSFFSRSRDAGQVILWPLGLLTEGSAGRRGTWRSVLMGQVVGVLLAILLAGALVLTGAGWGALVFDPFRPLAVVGGVAGSWVAVLWWAYYVNGILLVLNSVPMLPLDGGRVLERALRIRRGVGSAVALAARLGILVGALLFVVAMGIEQVRLMGVAVAGCAVCFGVLRRAEFVRELDAAIGSVGEPAGLDREEENVVSEDRHALLRPLLAPTKGEEDGEVDGVLEKISLTGIDSLNDHEKEVLGRATQRRRGR